jgi:AhpD family alkylhydroperoxidase
MSNLVSMVLKVTALTVAMFLTCTAFAQEGKAYEKAIQEIQKEFGVVPTMFTVFPKHALAGVWESFKQLNSEKSQIPPKYRELLQLAVAAQIPCQYCIYFHMASAKAFGATDAEIQEAIAQGAQTRFWSMILQGNQIDLDDFKAEFDAMMTHMSQKASMKQ